MFRIQSHKFCCDARSFALFVEWLTWSLLPRRRKRARFYRLTFRVKLCPPETPFKWVTPRNPPQSCLHRRSVRISGASACGDGTYDSNYACENGVFMQIGGGRTCKRACRRLSAHRFFLFFFFSSNPSTSLWLLHLRLFQILESFESTYTHKKKQTKTIGNTKKRLQLFSFYFWKHVLTAVFVSVYANVLSFTLWTNTKS